jgi:hypothetical protein
MGFIQDNTNTFEVYLTDLGKQKFFDGGFKDAIVYFSLIDSDSNYEIFEPAQNEIIAWVTGNSYNIGEVVLYNNKFYRKVAVDMSSPTTEYEPDNLTYWDEIRPFDTTNINLQPIPTINHVTGTTTSLANGSVQCDCFSHDVFVQTSMRGNKVDNMVYRRALFGVKSNTQKNYILHEPDLSTSQVSPILTYIKK